MDETSLNGAKSTGFLITTKKGEDAIRLRHVVFEVRCFFWGGKYFLTTSLYRKSTPLQMPVVVRRLPPTRTVNFSSYDSILSNFYNTLP